MILVLSGLKSNLKPFDHTIQKRGSKPPVLVGKLQEDPYLGNKLKCHQQKVQTLSLEGNPFKDSGVQKSNPVAFWPLCHLKRVLHRVTIDGARLTNESDTLEDYERMSLRQRWCDEQSVQMSDEKSGANKFKTD
ncbi:hypothetical protein TNCV_1262811 [Trichonephila clavipes]|nr:hypothetical protein TNCV_1262811 [Trichonephila clavipes]